MIVDISDLNETFLVGGYMCGMNGKPKFGAELVTVSEVRRVKGHGAEVKNALYYKTRHLQGWPTSYIMTVPFRFHLECILLLEVTAYMCLPLWQSDDAGK